MDQSESFELTGADLPDLHVAHEVQVDLFTGAAVVRVPIPTTDGRSGFSPSLALSYDSNGGNSVFGMGWSLAGLHPITRGTRRQLPRYDGTDGYRHADHDLVPAIDDATGQRRTAVSGAYTVQFFRPQDDTSSLRLERWIHNGGEIHWRLREPGNVVTVYGAAADGSTRIADPDAPERIHSWLPQAQFDGYGNVIRYDYRAEDGAGVDLADPAERGHMRVAGWPQRYLTGVRYGNTSPFGPDNVEPTGNRWLFEVVFDYGDHPNDRLAPDAMWPARVDAYSTYRPGFDLRTHRLCRRVLMFHHIGALGPGPTLVTITELDHDEHPAGATLSRVTHIGVRRDGARRSMPPLQLGYSAPAVGVEFAAVPDGWENAPVGFSDRSSRWLDLYGEGLPGFLVETPYAWYYKANAGGGRLAPQVRVATRPTRAGTGASLSDFDGNGSTDLFSTASRFAGAAIRDRVTHDWAGFRAFTAMPQLQAAGSLAQWLDIDGDGLPEPVLADASGLTTFAGLSRNGSGQSHGGFGAPQRVAHSGGSQGPPAVRDAPEHGLFLVDMNGDGLADLVQVTNGSVRYWPQLGHGRFGPAVVMDNPPDFGSDTEYDPARLRFVDLDGSGTADLVYLGRGELRRWINASGNRYISQPTMTGLPYVDRLAAVDVLDLLGDGRACLVWSTPLAGQSSPVRYAPLTGPVAPRLLVNIANSMGGEVRLEYGSSAAHLLRDRKQGRDWHSRMPHHPIVVNRKEHIDHIDGGRALTWYEYHDGFFDGDALAARGFGLVDVYDADTAADDLAEPDTEPTAVACLRTWLHTGAPDWSKCLADGYSLDQTLPIVQPASFENLNSLAPGEYEDGMRCLAGRVVREETYAVGASGLRDAHPFAVTQLRYQLRRLQVGVLRADVVESVHHCYEGQASTPRVTQTVVAELDRYGTPLLSVQLGHGQTPVVTAKRNTVLSPDLVGWFELAIPVETVEYELIGLPPAPVAGVAGQTDAVVAALGAALSRALMPHEPWPTAPGSYARIIGREQHYYWSADRAGAMPLGQVSAPVLKHHDEEASFTDPQVAAALAAGPGAAPIGFAQLTALGYQRRGDYWWSPGSTHTYTPAATFSRPTGSTRWDGAVTQVGYDPYWLEPVLHIDAAGNRDSVDIDYHLLTPWRHTDPNGAVHEVRHDPLGVIVASASYGIRLGADNVTEFPYGDTPLPAVVALPADASVSLLTTAPAVLAGVGLAGAGEVFAYDLFAYATGGSAPRMVHVVREQLARDGRGGTLPVGRLQINVSYFDGLGRTVQNKRLLEPGRWLVSGAVVYDAKQQPVREYESWFDTSPDQQPDHQIAQVGVARRIRYDAVGRTIRVDEPDGTLTRTVHLPWRVIYFDHNDTVQESLYRVSREGLADGTPEREALRAAQAHANTPRVTFLDPMGREISKVESTGAEDRTISQGLDARGEQLQVLDPRGLVAFNFVRDMHGRVLFRNSIDAGDSWWLPDAAGRQVHHWDGRGVHTLTAFDGLDRITAVRMGVGTGPTRLAQTYLYGEDPSIDHATARNARGRVIQQWDEAGLLIVNQYSPEGEVLRRDRRICTNYTAEPDWSNPAAVQLDPTPYVSEYDVDATGRPVREALPDGTIRSIGYAPQGGVTYVQLAFADGSASPQVLLQSATFNARGDQIGAMLGNGVTLANAFDGETFRPSAISARRSDGTLLQDLRYTYDPVGNVTYCVDLAQQPGVVTPLLTGATASTHSEYRYDALYRLLGASGRVHQALLEHDYSAGSNVPGGFRGTRHLTLNNGQAVERYTQQYSYDLADNLTRLVHQGISRGWTTDMWTSPVSNRGLPARGLTGLPVTNPETRFDLVGNTRALPHLAKMEWGERASQLSRAVLVDRSAAGLPDDAEYYCYGGDGLRVRKVSQRLIDVATRLTEVTEKIYVDGCEIVRIRRGGRLVLQRYTSNVSDGQQRLAIVHRWTLDSAGAQTAPVPGPAGGSTVRTRYQLANMQGSATLELDDAGAVISYEEFFPYGGSSFIAGDNLREVATKDCRFRGAERDDITGLYYGGHRYYAPWIGRWISADPVGPADSLNLYTFCLNNPVSYHDPDALTAVWQLAGRAPAAGAQPARSNVETRLRRDVAALPPSQRAIGEQLLKENAAGLKSATGYQLEATENFVDGKLVGGSVTLSLSFRKGPGPGPAGELGASVAPPRPSAPKPPPAAPPPAAPKPDPPGAPPSTSSSAAPDAVPPDDPSAVGDTPPAESSDPPEDVGEDADDWELPEFGSDPVDEDEADPHAEPDADEPEPEEPGDPEDDPLADLDSQEWGEDDDTDPELPAEDGEFELGPPVPVGSIETGFAIAPLDEPDELSPDPPAPRGLRDDFIDGFTDEAVETLQGEVAGRLMLALTGPAGVIAMLPQLGHSIADTYREEGRGVYGVLGVVNMVNPASLLMRAAYTSDQEAEQAIYLKSLGDSEGAAAHARASGQAYFNVVHQSVNLGMVVAGGLGGVKSLGGKIKKMKGPKGPKGPGKMGDAGAHSRIKNRNKNTGNDSHHMPAASRGFTPRATGGAISLLQKLHKLTRTYGWKGKLLKRLEKGLPFRQTLTRDLLDLRKIVRKHVSDPNERKLLYRGMRDLLNYYRKHPTKRTIRDRMLPASKRVLPKAETNYIKANLPYLHL